MTFPGLVRANNLSDVIDRERAWDNLGSSLSTGDIAIPTPSLDLNFAATKSLVDGISGNNLITFSRSSTGTFVGSNGLIQTAASGVPRFDHNPATGESLGLLVEEARTNTMYPSIISPGGSWIYYSLTPTYNAAIAPDGTNTATLLKPNAGSGSFRAVSVRSHPAGPGMISFYAKSNGLGWVGIASGLGDSFAYSSASYNVLTGASRTYFLGTSGYKFNSAINVGNGWWRIFIEYYGSPYGEYGYVGVTTNASGDIVSNSTANGIDGMYVWGVQFEVGTFATSYIPTTATTVTRAADVAQITGANFSSWYNNEQGTAYLETKNIKSFDYSQASFAGFDGSGGLWDNVQEWGLRYNSSSNTFELAVQDSSGTNAISFGGDRRSTAKVAVGLSRTSAIMAINGNTQAVTRSGGTMPVVNSLLWHQSGNPRQSTCFSRFIYYPVRLNNEALQYITQLSISSLNVYSFSLAIKGRDILALEDVRNTSTRDFVFIKGLTAVAQPRITTAANNTASGVARRDLAMPKLAPTTSGNYFFSSGVTLSGISTRINNTPALSIATSPFSGSTATAPLLFRELRPQANWRITEPMPSGTIATPEVAIPFETNDFVLYMKAGQN